MNVLNILMQMEKEDSKNAFSTNAVCLNISFSTPEHMNVFIG
jgi:hypothetical protein